MTASSAAAHWSHSRSESARRNLHPAFSAAALPMSSTPCARPASATVAVHADATEAMSSSPRGLAPARTSVGALNHPSLPLFSTNHRRRQVCRRSPFLASQPQCSGLSWYATDGAFVASRRAADDASPFTPLPSPPVLALWLTHSPAREPSATAVAGSNPRSSHHWNAAVTSASATAPHVAASALIPNDVVLEPSPLFSSTTVTIKMVGSLKVHLVIFSIAYERPSSTPPPCHSGFKNATPSKPTCATTFSMSPPSRVGRSITRYRAFPCGAPGSSAGRAASLDAVSEGETPPYEAEPAALVEEKPPKRACSTSAGMEG
mmetsp:Transcript_10635/g.44555  ORF Transcript_10635/g.44555 Transcript_10635/m.44555 type:complete len:319 (-) Transcript_10635:587-1543(-)